MGRFADLREAYLKERRRALYRELKAAGKLREHCLEAEREALHRLNSLVSQGWNQDQAEEMARAVLMDQ